MHFSVMGLDRAEGSGTEVAVLKIIPVCWVLVMGIQVLLEVKRPVLTVVKVHVVAEGGWQQAGHIT